MNYYKRRRRVFMCCGSDWGMFGGNTYRTVEIQTCIPRDSITLRYTAHQSLKFEVRLVSVISEHELPYMIDVRVYHNWEIDDQFLVRHTLNPATTRAFEWKSRMLLLR